LSGLKSLVCERELEKTESASASQWLRYLILEPPPQQSAGRKMAGNLMRHHTQGPKWSMRPRTPRGGSDDGPGPGAYHTESFSSISDLMGSKEVKYPHGASYSMRAKVGVVRRGNDVGPGAYNHASSKDLGQAVKYSMRPRTAPPQAQDGPGPGAYRPEGLSGNASSPALEKFAKAASYSMRQRTASARSIDSPGPGAYEVGKVAAIGDTAPAGHKGFQKSPTYKMSSAGRFATPRGGTPAPNAYNPSDPTQVCPQYTFRARLDREGRSPTPGPGAYGQTCTQFY